MKFSYVFQIFVCFAVIVFLGACSQKILPKSLNPLKWASPHADFSQPHLEAGKLPHNSQWDDDTWSPQVWTDARGGEPLNVVRGFYAANIVVDQYEEDNVPVLEVGQGFLELSEQDKRRVVLFMDDTYRATSSEAGVLRIALKDYERDLGLLTPNGLQFQ